MVQVGHVWRCAGLLEDVRSDTYWTACTACGGEGRDLVGGACVRCHGVGESFIAWDAGRRPIGVEQVSRTLVTAERHVVDGEARISRQRLLVARLERLGQDVSLATDVLKLFQTTQFTYVADRDRLKALVQRLN